MARLRRALLPLALALLLLGHLTTDRFHWSCPIARVTHHPCPTCGITTATKYILTLRFADAWAMHPLSFVVVPLLGLLVSLEMGRFVWTGELGHYGKMRVTKLTTLVLALALFALWIARFFGAFGGPVVVW